MLFVDFGTNYRFGATDVYVHQSLKAHIPAFIELAELDRHPLLVTGVGACPHYRNILVFRLVSECQVT